MSAFDLRQITAHELESLRLKAADRDQWQEVAMKARAEADERLAESIALYAKADTMATALNAMRDRTQWINAAFAGADERALANVQVRKGLDLADELQSTAAKETVD